MTDEQAANLDALRVRSQGFFPGFDRFITGLPRAVNFIPATTPPGALIKGAQLFNAGQRFFGPGGAWSRWFGQGTPLPSDFDFSGAIPQSDGFMPSPSQTPTVPGGDDIPTVAPVVVPLDPNQDTGGGHGGVARIANIVEGDRPGSIYGNDMGGRIASFAGPGFAAGENIPGGGAFGTNFESLGFGAGGGGFFNTDPNLSRRIGFQGGGIAQLPQLPTMGAGAFPGGMETVRSFKRKKPTHNVIGMVHTMRPAMIHSIRPLLQPRGFQGGGVAGLDFYDPNSPYPAGRLEYVGTPDYTGKYLSQAGQNIGQAGYNFANARQRQQYLQGLQAAQIVDWGSSVPSDFSFANATPTGYQQGGAVSRLINVEDLQGKERENTLTPQEMDLIYRIRQQAAEAARARAMNEPTSYQYGGAVMPPDMGGMGVVPDQGNPQMPGMGTDNVPAMLTPGEMVLTQPQQAAVQVKPGQAHKLKPEQRKALGAAKGAGSFSKMLKKR